MSKMHAPAVGREPTSATARKTGPAAAAQASLKALFQAAPALAALQLPEKAATGSASLHGLVQLQDRLSSPPPPYRSEGGQKGAHKGAHQSAIMQELAQRGIAGMGEPLPYLQTIQKSFGRHDVSGIAAYTGQAASRSALAMGASAFATGRHVAFAGQPDLRTSAHEAAHVIQQRGGVQLSGGVGQLGDPHERHADAVAERVVQGQSSEALLDAYARPGQAPAGAVGVQLSPLTDFVSGFVKKAGVSGIGAAGAQLAEPLLAKARQDAGQLVSQAVQNFLKTNPDAQNALRAALFARYAGKATAEAAKALTSKLRSVCAEKFNAAIAEVRIEAGKALTDLTPEAVRELTAALDAELEKVRENAILQQAEAVASTIIDGAKDMGGSLAEGLGVGAMNAVIDQAISRFVGSKEMVKMAGEAAAQAVTSSAAYQGAQQLLQGAESGQKLVSGAIDRAQGVVDALESRVIKAIPGAERVTNAISSGAEKLGESLPQARDALRKIRPGQSGAINRAGQYTAEQLVGGGGQLDTAKQGLKELGKTANEQGQQAAQQALDETGSGLPSAQSVMNGVTFMSDMSQAPQGKEAEAAGSSAARMALTTAGGAAGTAAASMLIPATASPLVVAAAPVIAGGAVAYAAANSQMGQFVIKKAGQLSQGATELPLVGLPWQKATQMAAFLSSGTNALLQNVRPALLGGSDEAVANAEKQLAGSGQELLKDWSLQSLVYGVSRPEPTEDEAPKQSPAPGGSAAAAASAAPKKPKRKQQPPKGPKLSGEQKQEKKKRELWLKIKGESTNPAEWLAKWKQRYPSEPPPG